MAIYGRKEAKISADVKLKQAYQKYFKGMRSKKKQPMTFYHWKKSGRRSGYGDTKGTTSQLSRLHRSGRKKIGLPD